MDPAGGGGRPAPPGAPRRLRGRAPTPRREARWLAAVLACRPSAVLSHASAAELWGIGGASGVPHVTVATHLRPRGITTHEARLAPADVSRRARIPVTSPSRTVVDQAHGLDDEGIERMLREAQFRGLFGVGAMRDALARRNHRFVRELLDDLNATQSMLEDAFLRLCRRYGIAAPRAQVRRGRRRPDFVWKDERLIVEVDSWMAHSTPHAFQADRTLSNAVQLAGWMILRFTYTDVRRRGAMVAAQVHQALDRR